MAASCSSVQNSHISWDDFLSDDLVIMHCDVVESSFKIKQENEDQSTVSDRSSTSHENQNERLDTPENNIKDDLLDYCENQQNPNTTAKTRRESDRFFRFLLDQGENRKPEQLPPHILDPFIGKFLKELKKEKTGEDYEPDTITSYHR